MNMSQVLHRRSHAAPVVDAPASAPGAVPPSVHPPDRRDSPSRWPSSAKAVVAVLVVATVLGALGTAIASSSANDDGNASLQARIAELIDERDDALGDVAALDAELIAARTDLAAARTDLADAVAANDGLAADIGELEARVAALTEQRAEALADAEALTVTVASLEATIAELGDEVARLDARGDMLDAALKAANDRAADAIADREALAELFPINVDGSLGRASLVGDHDADLTLVFSAGSAIARAVDEVTISRNSAGHLRLNVPGLVEGGLFDADGALHLVATSTTAFPAVDGVARRAEVTITLFPDSFRITDDGKQVVSGVSGVMTLAAPATGSAPAATAFYAIELS